MLPWFVILAAAQAATTVQVDSLSADGMELRQIECSLDKGGLLGPLAVVATVASAKKDLDACAPGGGAFRAEWSWASGKTGEIAVTEASEAGKTKCIEKALESLTTDLVGTCSVVLLTGDTTAATAAVGKMVPTGK